jgi:hypothetical protein
MVPYRCDRDPLIMATSAATHFNGNSIIFIPALRDIKQCVTECLYFKELRDISKDTPLVTYVYELSAVISKAVMIEGIKIYTLFTVSTEKSGNETDAGRDKLKNK